MIQISKLSKRFKNNAIALQNLSLQIENRGIIGLVGPNGAGKTTLMRILAGILRPTSGSVNVFGNDLKTRAGREATKARLGYLPQELHVYQHLTAQEFLDYIAIIKGIRSKTARQMQIKTLLETVNLADAANQRLKTFSGGMKRRVGIAQALLGNPQLIIVDEPTVGLDPEERVRFRSLLASLALNHTVILSTHIIEDISQSCHQLVVMKRGQVIFNDTPQQLIQHVSGRVWHIHQQALLPNDGLAVVSSEQTANGMRYRVLGTPNRAYNATATDATLEDGYLWLMHQYKQALN